MVPNVDYTPVQDEQYKDKEPSRSDIEAMKTLILSLGGYVSAHTHVIVDGSQSDSLHQKDTPHYDDYMGRVTSMALYELEEG